MQHIFSKFITYMPFLASHTKQKIILILTFHNGFDHTLFCFLFLFWNNFYNKLWDLKLKSIHSVKGSKKFRIQAKLHWTEQILFLVLYQYCWFGWLLGPGYDLLKFWRFRVLLHWPSQYKVSACKNQLKIMISQIFFLVKLFYLQVRKICLGKHMCT